MLRTVVQSVGRRSISLLPRESIQRLNYLGFPSSSSTVSCRQLSSTSLSYPPHEVVGLPSLSPTMESGSIAAWKMSEGDAFAAGDVYCSVETDKATMDFEAQDEGVLAKILVPAGAGRDVNVGDPIMVIVQDKAHVSAFANFVLATAGGGSATAPPPPAVAAAPSPTAPPVQPLSVAPTMAAAAGPSTTMGGRVVASPLARMLAQEKGLDIATLVGTGPGGRILAADVKEYVVPQLQQQQQQRVAAAAATTTTTVAAPTTTTAGGGSPALGSSTSDWALVSKQTVPHYYLTVDIRVDALQALRESWSSQAASSSTSNGGGGVSLHACLIKAAALSMKSVPAVNAAYLGDTVRYYQNVDLQVIGDSTLVVKNCANLGLSAIESIVSTTNDADDDSVAGTFSFCNLGMYGIASCAPIIRPPQACALAVGAVETVLVPSKDDAAVPYQTVSQLTATLSCDHRVVDGAVGAQWLATFKNYVEHPTTLLL